jgi:hypothetical protein
LRSHRAAHGLTIGINEVGSKRGRTRQPTAGRPVPLLSAERVGPGQPLGGITIVRGPLLVPAQSRVRHRSAVPTIPAPFLARCCGRARRMSCHQLRLTKCSSETYRKHARQFVAYFKGSTEPLGAEHVRRWLRWQSSMKRLSPAIVNVAIAALRHLFATLDRPDVTAGIGSAPARKPSVDVLTENEAKCLLSAPTNTKHRAMCALLYGACLRI